MASKQAQNPSEKPFGARTFPQKLAIVATAVLLAVIAGIVLGGAGGLLAVFWKLASGE